MQSMGNWTCALSLDAERRIVAGSTDALCAHIRGGADLRIYTEFYHDEHIDTDSANHELVREVSDFPATYLLADRWAAGIMTMRQPVVLPKEGFGQPSMSFFMYNQNGQQAIARPHLHGTIPDAPPGPSAPNDHSRMRKYHELDHWDASTNAPNSNFIYDFEIYRYYVRDVWREVLSHTSRGEVISGSPETLEEAFARGCEVKVGIRNLCSDLVMADGEHIEHELFIQLGPCYYYTDAKMFIGESRPLVRVEPHIPLRYRSGNWDFGWVIARTDGSVSSLYYDPYTFRYRKQEDQHAIRWFVSGI